MAAQFISFDGKYSCKRKVVYWLYCRHRYWGSEHSFSLKLGQTSKERVPTETVKDTNMMKLRRTFRCKCWSLSRDINLLEWIWWYSWPEVAFKMSQEFPTPCIYIFGSFDSWVSAHTICPLTSAVTQVLIGWLRKPPRLRPSLTCS